VSAASRIISTLFSYQTARTDKNLDQFGVFFGNYHRRYRDDFEVVF
jgi:hypothetical protein